MVSGTLLLQPVRDFPLMGVSLLQEFTVFPFLTYRTLTRFWPPPTSFFAPLHQGRLLESGRNGKWNCLLSQFFSPSSKKAQPGYAKGVSEGARSTSVYGTWVKMRLSILKIYNENIFNQPIYILPQFKLGYGENRNSDWSMIYCSVRHAMLSTTLSKKGFNVYDFWVPAVVPDSM